MSKDLFYRIIACFVVLAVYAWTYVLLKDKEWNPDVIEIPTPIAEPYPTPVDGCFITDDNYLICKLREK